MTKLNDAVIEMLKQDSNGRDEFWRIENALKDYKKLNQSGAYKYNFITSRLEIRKVRKDREMCEYLSDMGGSSIPMLVSFGSREVMRDVILILMGMKQ